MTASPAYLADLARPDRIRVLLRHCRARARLRRQALSTVLAGAVRLARTGYDEALRQAAHQLTHPRRAGGLRWCAPAALASWLTPPARRTLAEAINEVADRIRVEPPISRHRAWCEIREFGAYQAELSAQLKATGVPAHAPFLDNQVVRACMAIPVHQRMRPERQKPLLGDALAGLVPQCVLSRPTKGAYDGNAFAGIRRNAPRLRELIAQSQLADADLINPEAVAAELRRLVAGAPGHLASLETVVTTELWLHQTETTTHRWTEQSHG